MVDGKKGGEFSIDIVESDVTSVIGERTGGKEDLRPAGKDRIGNGHEEQQVEHSSGAESDNRNASVTNYVLFCAFCASLNSANLGYDIGVSGGAFFIAKENLGLTEWETEILIGSLNVMAVLGAMFSRSISDTFGRTRTLAVGSGFFFVGSLLLAGATTFGTLLVGRMMLGIGVGAGLSIDPLYISEISPPEHRGFLVSCSELSINIGIIGGFVASYGLSGLRPDIAWRVMVGLGALLPVAMLCISLAVMPESPRHLVRKGQDQRAAEVLSRLLDRDAESQAVETVIADIERDLAQDQMGLSTKELVLNAPPPLQLMLILVVTIAVAQHASGVEAFIYYTPFILRGVGFESASDILGITAAMGVVKTLTLIPVSIALDQPWGGRRRMLLLSYAGMGCALVLLAVGTSSHSRLLLLPAVFGYVIFFSVGAGPVCWLLASEILPTDARARGMMLAVVPNRFMASVVSLTFLSATSDSASSAFLVFASVCFLVCVFVYCRCPETKGRSLEEMYHLFAAIARHNARSSRSLGCFSSLFCVSPLILGTHAHIDDGGAGALPSSSPRTPCADEGADREDAPERGGESLTTPMVALT